MECYSKEPSPHLPPSSLNTQENKQRCETFVPPTLLRALPHSATECITYIPLKDVDNIKHEKLRKARTATDKGTSTRSGNNLDHHNEALKVYHSLLNTWFLFERQIHRDVRRDRKSSIHWLTPQVLKSSRAGQVQNQETRACSGPPRWVLESQDLGHFCCFPRDTVRQPDCKCGSQLHHVLTVSLHMPLQTCTSLDTSCPQVSAGPEAWAYDLGQGPCSHKTLTLSAVLCSHQ